MNPVDMSLQHAVNTFLALEGRAEGTERMYRSILERWLELAHTEKLRQVSELRDEHAALLHTQVKLVTRGRGDAHAQGHPPMPGTRRLWRAVLREFWEYLILQGAEHLNTNRAGAFMRIEHDAPLPDLPEQLLNAALQIAQELTSQDLYDMQSKRGPQQYLAALRNHALLLTLRHTGMRVSEAVSLRRGDIEWTQRPIRARITGKGRKDRRVYFTTDCRRALRRYLAARDASGAGDSGGKSSQPLFVGHNHRNPGRAAITPQTVWRVVRELGEQAAAELTARTDDADEETETLPDLHPHHARHAFATEIWRKTSDLHLAQKLLGHASPTTTARYTHADDEDLAARYTKAMGDDTEKPEPKDDF